MEKSLSSSRESGLYLLGYSLQKTELFIALLVA